MFYYDPDFGYIWITSEQFGGHVLHGKGPSRPYDPGSVEVQRYTSRDRHRWRETIDVPDDWLEAFGIEIEKPEADVVGPSTIYDIRIERPKIKRWQAWFTIIVVIIYRVLIWNSTR